MTLRNVGGVFMRLFYPICLYPCEEGGYCVTIPDLGCATQGDDYADAIYMATDAASVWVLDEIEDGGKPPKPSDPLTIKADEYEGGIVSVIMLDLDAYAEKYGKKPVNKTCTIPLWLNTRCEAEHFDFSEILKEALLKKLNMLFD